MAAPSFVYILVSTPTNERTIGSIPDTTTWSVYEYPIEGTIEDTVNNHTTQYPLGSLIRVTTDARCDTYTLNVKLDEGDTKAEKQAAQEAKEAKG